MATDNSPPTSSHQTCVAAIILAGGRGSRMQDASVDKSLALLNGLPIFCYSVRAFGESNCIRHFTIVYRDNVQKAQLQDAINTIALGGTPIDWIQGGKERQDSVYNALRSLPESHTHVFIHDSARPLVTADSIRKLYSAAIRDRAAALAHPVTDTIKRIPSANDLMQTQLEDLDRSRLWAIETPQAFAHDVILKAYKYVMETGLNITDDTAAISAIGHGVTLVPNNSPNIKITQPEDMNYAAWWLSENQPLNAEHRKSNAE